MTFRSGQLTRHSPTVGAALRTFAVYQHLNNLGMATFLLEKDGVATLFVAGFLLLLLFIKMALANFSIEMTALSKAVIAALFAARALLILDETPLAPRL